MLAKAEKICAITHNGVAFCDAQSVSVGRATCPGKEVLGIASANTRSADEAAQLRRTGKEMTLRIEWRDEFPARPNPSLIKLIVRAHLFEAKLLQSDGPDA